MEDQVRSGGVGGSGQGMRETEGFRQGLSRSKGPVMF